LKGFDTLTIKIYLPSIMRRPVGGHSSVKVAGSSVGEALTNLVSAYSGLRHHVFDESGTIRRHLIVILNGEDLRGIATGLNTPITECDDVRLLPAVAGG
jgi:molybdopterin converting factor small subunit